MTDKIDSGVSSEDWEATPESVKKIVSDLLARYERLNQQYKALSVEVSPLLAEMRQMEEKVLSTPKHSTSQVGKGFGRQSSRRANKRRGKR